jgi:hypothetical protein
MIEILKEKILKWSEEETDKFHNNIPRVDKRKGSYVWTYSDYGFFHNGIDAADFYRKDGRIFSLSKIGYKCDWDMNLELWKIGQTTENFRIAKPIAYDEVKIRDEVWTYTEHQYPNFELGYPDSGDRLLDDPYGAIKEYAENITVILYSFKELHENFKVNYPRKVKIGNRIKDKEGYFWKDIKYWHTEPNEFLDEHVGEVQKLINIVNQMGNKLDNSLTEQSRELWTKIITS